VTSLRIQGKNCTGWKARRSGTLRADWCRHAGAGALNWRLLSGVRQTSAILGFMIFAGYFARRIAPRPDLLDAPGVREICSVGECISSGAEGWISSWRHNGLGWFNSVADAFAVVPERQRAEFRLFAYRLYPEVFRGRDRVALMVRDDIRPEPLPDSFRSLGFDSASKSSEDGLSLECSPLSCNVMAGAMPVNEHCLFPTLDAALAGAARFAAEQPEPGDYYVVEVLEGPRIDPSRSTKADRAST
jgi:hypothetical protein